MYLHSFHKHLLSTYYYVPSTIPPPIPAGRGADGRLLRVGWHFGSTGKRQEGARATLGEECPGAGSCPRRGPEDSKQSLWLEWGQGVGAEGGRWQDGPRYRFQG